MPDFKCGDKASVTRIFTDAEVRKFAEISRDVNPIHLDDDYAAGTVFEKRIVHGMLVSSVFSALIANELPGNGTIYLNQSLQFKAPVYIGEEITATVEIIKIREDKPIATLKTTCINESGDIAVEGEAVVKYPG